VSRLLIIWLLLVAEAVVGLLGVAVAQVDLERVRVSVLRLVRHTP